MNRIAALYTCHNRKDKTVQSLSCLKIAIQELNETISFDIYLTDDGSTDGTESAAKKIFPNIKLLDGDGSLFWAEGMRMSWSAAIIANYDAYLLLNDDTELYPNAINELLKAHTYCIKTYEMEGIYVGATQDLTGKLTYSGSLIINKFLYTQKRLEPNGQYQLCDLANANIMLVTNEVVNKIGILTEGYAHGKADYDYTLKARQKNIPVLIVPEYCGHCENDHYDFYKNFNEISIADRKNIVYSPINLDFKSHIKFMRKFFPLRAPIVLLMAWIKIYFPKIYLRFFLNR